MRLSIVATLYKSSKYIDEFCAQTMEVGQKVSGGDFEIILVNDGSPDDSLEVATALALQNPRVKVVDLSRNFGHHSAMMAGLRYAAGEKIFLIDSDLEENPEWLGRFDEVMQETQADVVYGVQEKRKGGMFERITGGIFYRLFRLFTEFEIPENVVTARLMTRRYVDSLLLHEEREINIFGLFVISGYHQVPVQVRKSSSSPTTYSLSRKIRLFVNSFTSFSSAPLVFTFYSGVLISLSALLYIALLVIKYLTVSTAPDGYTSLIVSIWFFSGLIIFFLGIQGIYISKVYQEAKRRPAAIVRAVIGGNRGRE